MVVVTSRTTSFSHYYCCCCPRYGPRRQSSLVTVVTTIMLVSLFRLAQGLPLSRTLQAVGMPSSFVRGKRRQRDTALFQSTMNHNDNHHQESDKNIHPSLRPIHSLTSHITTINLPSNQRVLAYCLSDLHADGTSDNWSWITDRCVPPPTTTSHDQCYNILIVPGDMANSIPSLRRCFRFLAAHWDAVCYCVGNHEAWVQDEEVEEDNDTEDLHDSPECNVDNDDGNAANNCERTSVDQLTDVLNLAKEEGIHVGPVCLQYKNQNDRNDNDNKLPLWMVPLQSFYHSSWDTEPDLQDPAILAAEQRRSFRQRWNDFRNMKWPTALTTHEEFTQGENGRGGSLALARAFGDLNTAFLDSFEKEERPVSTHTTILSFSHYVPRIELSPEKRFLIAPQLARVIGSNRLEEDIRRLRPDLHLFGHTHIPIGLKCDGIRYAQWPLGYPKEATRQCRTVVATGPMLVFDSSLRQSQPSASGVPSCTEAEQSHWSRHYQIYKRDPNNLEPAPWLRERLERIGRRTARK